MNIADLSFLLPWAFILTTLLPLLWFLMKTTPPKPKKISFPAVRLLQELSTEKIVATKTPWWVLLVRCLLVLCMITALAQPVLNQAKSIGDSENPVLLIVDNDWSVMDRWGDREQELALMVEQAERGHRPVLIVATANPFTSESLSFTSAKEAKQELTSLLVKPWQTNRSGWLIKLENLLGQSDTETDIFWITNGLLEEKDSRFASRLNELGNLNVIGDSQRHIPVLIRNVTRTTDGLEVQLNSLPDQNERIVDLHMLNDQGKTIYLHQETLLPGSTEQIAHLAFPQELRSQTERLRIGHQINAGAQFLMDERWRDKAVGIMAHQGATQSLLEATFYLDKALNPYVNVRFDELDYLLERDLSLLIDVGEENLNREEKQTIENWIANGGVFVRFANESHSLKTPGEDPLLPVQLLQGMRTFGGSMAWEEDPRLAPFEVNSPFQGIKQKDEIVIHQQVLARPSTQIAGNTWARLRDGTPLITSKKIGNGYSILFHVSANPQASDLPYSGVFEEMMVRLVSLSTGFSSADPEAELNPYLVFDSNGQLSPAADEVRTLRVKSLKERQPSPHHPPGLYGQSNALKSFNMGPQSRALIDLESLPGNTPLRGFDQVNEIDLVPWVLLGALSLALLDWFMTLRLKKYYKPALGALLCMLVATPLSAATNEAEDWERFIDAANHMRLAYMVTGDYEMDKISKRGLEGLGMVLHRRTAVEFSKPMPFDPEKDEPVLFPMIYWPITENQADLSEKAALRINAFLRAGGFILFDTLGKQQQDVMIRLSEQLNIGRLAPVREPHVMTRSFYLLQKFPGRFDNAEVWVEAEQDASRDRVSSILVGSNSWAHAWARDEQLRPLYPVVPGGEVQREHAYRFGVNLVMYILSGNYKGDQVHMPAIIQRLGL